MTMRKVIRRPSVQSPGYGSRSTNCNRGVDAGQCKQIQRHVVIRASNTRVGGNTTNRMECDNKYDTMNNVNNSKKLIRSHCLSCSSPAGRCMRSDRRFVRASAMSTDDQARELAAAQRRWEGQVRQGRFRSIAPEEVRTMMAEGWILLDVRPEEECAIASVEGAINVPLFTVDTSFSPGSLIKQMSAFGMGGWWLGTKHMVPNKSFMTEVMKVIPQDGKAIIACQKGLRSLAACEQLANAGFEHIAWLNGGYDMSKKGDLPVKGENDIRYAGIGGVSQLLGWTEVQQEENKGLGGGVSNVLKVIAALVALDTLVLLFEQAQYSGIV